MNRTSAFNNENFTNLNGKRVLTQNTQQNQRQPLGNCALMNVGDRKSKQYVSNLEPVKKRAEGVQTRSQTAKQEAFQSIGCAVEYDRPAFTIYEDSGLPEKEADFESMEVEERSIRESLPAAFPDSIMADDSVQYDAEEECEEDKEMEDYEDEYEEEGDISCTEEGPEEDSEMMNVQRKLRADVNEKYAIEHLTYSMSEYRKDIYQNMRTREVMFMPRPDYMRKQSDINHSMRSILIDWMVEVVDEYRLKRETFFLAVNYVDRYLSLFNIVRSNLQLVGTAALFIASKYEEVYPPNIGDFVTVTDGTYTNRQVLQMEYTMLKSLKFRTTVPTANFFCLDLLNQLSFEEIDYAMTFFILETVHVIGNEFLKFPPSVMAATSVLVSSLTLRKDNCINKITLHTGYELRHLIPCLLSVFRTFQNPSALTQNAVRNKFQASRYHSVSHFVVPQELALEDFLAGKF